MQVQRLLPAPPTRAPDLRARVDRVAAAAAAAAAAVDAEGRFPHEAVAAMRAERLFSLLVPADLGGGGAALRDAAGAAYRIGRACGSSAMIFAMHAISLACVLRHAGDSPWHRAFLRRVAEGELLLASSTTEGQRGGDVRASEAAVELADGRFRFLREASVMSYGEEADAVVTVARRAPDAAAADQVLLVLERADLRLERTGGWETMGMRGTCSAGFRLAAEGEAGQVMPAPYADIHAQTMTPVAHILWTSLWAGIAAEALERARQKLRRDARAAGGAAPIGLPAYMRAASAHRRLRAILAEALDLYEASAPEALAALDPQTRLTLLKVEASELAVEVALAALQACGLSGYRRTGEASVERALRDLLSAPLMINNDRIRANASMATLFARVPPELFEV